MLASLVGVVIILLFAVSCTRYSAILAGNAVAEIVLSLAPAAVTVLPVVSFVVVDPSASTLPLYPLIRHIVILD